jgi:TRAP-type C4-dicarboxylate transport system permease small subunit
MGRVRKFLDDLEENLLMLLLFVSVAVIFLQVIMRYVFQSSLSWSEELGRYIFIWLTWLSTGYAVRQKRHLRIEFLSDLFGERGRMILETVSMTIWCAFSLFLVDRGFVIASMVWRRGQVTAALEIPTAIVYAAVPVGAALMAIRLADEIIRSVRRLMSAR